MKILLRLAILQILISAPVMAQTSVKALPNGNLILEDFSADQVGGVPSRWYARDGDVKIVDMTPDKQQRYRYRIDEENGKKFMRYSGMEAMHINLPIRDTKDFTLSSHPILAWSWRVHSVPKGATEDDESRNDAAASIYVVYDISGLFKVPKVIRYTWSSSLKKGTILRKGKQRIVVMESGEEKLGEWVHFERNIADDYRELFGEEPPERPLAILVLSDANNTKSFSFADYGPIYLKKK